MCYTIDADFFNTGNVIYKTSIDKIAFKEYVLTHKNALIMGVNKCAIYDNGLHNAGFVPSILSTLARHPLQLVDLLDFMLTEFEQHVDLHVTQLVCDAIQHKRLKSVICLASRPTFNIENFLTATIIEKPELEGYVEHILACAKPDISLKDKFQNLFISWHISIKHIARYIQNPEQVRWEMRRKHHYPDLECAASVFAMIIGLNISLFNIS